MYLRYLKKKIISCPGSERTAQENGISIDCIVGIEKMQVSEYENFKDVIQMI